MIKLRILKKNKEIKYKKIKNNKKKIKKKKKKKVIFQIKIK